MTPILCGEQDAVAAVLVDGMAVTFLIVHRIFYLRSVVIVILGCHDQLDKSKL